MTLPTVAVLYDDGAAGPAEIVSAARGLCIPVLVCDPTHPSIGPFLPSLARRCHVVSVDMASPTERTAALRSVAPDAVTTFSERCMEATAQTAQDLGLIFHDERTTSLLTDKVAQRAALRSAGVDDLRYAPISTADDLDEAAAVVGFPAIVKPRRGFGSIGVSRVDSQADLERVWQETSHLGPHVLEEYLVGDPSVIGEQWGDYVSVESVVLDGTVIPAFITGKLPLAPPFRERGIIVPAAVPDCLIAALESISSAAIRACGVTRGITHVEIKLTSAGPRILEVHGRLGGYLAPLGRRALNIDMVRLALQVALGSMPGFARSRAARARGVAMEYFLLGDPADTELVDITGVDAAMRLPGVLAVDIRARPGDHLDWRAGSRSQWGSVHVDVASHRDIGPTVRAIESTVRATFADRDPAGIDR